MGDKDEVRGVRKEHDEGHVVNIPLCPISFKFGGIELCMRII